MMTNFTQTRGTMPTAPGAVDVALEASVPNERATAMIAASWVLAETFTGRTYWPVTNAQALGVLDADGEARWPRDPAPDALGVDLWQAGAWVPHTGHTYVPEQGLVTDLAAGRYRFTQEGLITPDVPAAHVVEAVRALALYQLIHSPARREFRVIDAGDSRLSREALAGLFKASGAGILLSSEVVFNVAV